MKHFNNGNGKAVCGAPLKALADFVRENGDLTSQFIGKIHKEAFVSWKSQSDCPDCNNIKVNLQRRIRIMRRLESDRIILQKVLDDNDTEVSLDDAEAITQRLREIKIERENLFPKDLNEAFFMGQMQEEEAVEHE